MFFLPLSHKKVDETIVAELDLRVSSLLKQVLPISFVFPINKQVDT